MSFNDWEDDEFSENVCNGKNVNLEERYEFLNKYSNIIQVFEVYDFYDGYQVTVTSLDNIEKNCYFQLMIQMIQMKLLWIHYLKKSYQLFIKWKI